MTTGIAQAQSGVSLSPHDALFRFTFNQPEHAAALLRLLLPPEVCARLDWSSVQLLPGTRLDRRLRRHQTDLLFTVRGRAAERHYIHVVVEHSSAVDRWTALRMLDYAVGWWRQLVRDDPAPRSLPPVYAVVVHHGTQPWTAVTEFAELFAAGHRSPVSTPRFRYVVKSLHQMSAAQVEGLALTVLGKLTLAFLQFVPGAEADVLARLFRRPS